MLTRQHIKKLWSVFTLAFGVNWTSRGLADTGDVWYTALKDLSPQEFESGLSRIASTDSPFPPSLGQFRSWCRSFKPVPSPADRARLAWQEVMDARECPADPVTRHVLRAFGGWETFCRSLTYDNMPWHEKRFIEHYIASLDAASTPSIPLQEDTHALS